MRDNMMAMEMFMEQTTIICAVMLVVVFGKNCDFEHFDSCGWQQSTMDDGDWVISDKAGLITSTGPPTGHTSNEKNFYAYLNARDYKDENNNVIYNSSAVLISPALTNGTSELCFRFFYYMYGSQVNSLTVSTVFLNSAQTVEANTKTEFFKKSGNKGQKWICQRNILTFNSSSRIYIEAKTGINIECNIAIDDLSFPDLSECQESIPCDPSLIITSTTTQPLNSGSTRNTTTINISTITQSTVAATEQVPPPEDDNIILYATIVPIGLFVVVAVIAGIFYCKRSPETPPQYTPTTNNGVRINEQYGTNNDVYTEINEEEVYSDLNENGMREQQHSNSAYLEPIVPNVYTIYNPQEVPEPASVYNSLRRTTDSYIDAFNLPSNISTGNTDSVSLNLRGSEINKALDVPPPPCGFDKPSR